MAIKVKPPHRFHPTNPRNRFGGDDVDDLVALRRGAATRPVVGTDGASAGVKPPKTDAGKQIDELGGVSATHPAVRGTVAKPSAMDSMLSASDQAVMIAGAVPGLGLLGGQLVGGVLEKGGKAVRLSFIERVGARINNFLKKADAVTFTQVGETTGLGSFFGKATQAAADATAFIARPFGNLLGKNRQTANIGKAHTHFLRAKDVLEKLDIANAPEALRPHLQKMHDAVYRAQTVGHIDQAGYAAAKEAFEAAAQTLGDAPRATLKNAAKLDKAVNKAFSHHNASATWGNLEHSIQQSPKTLAKTGALHGVMNGAWIVGSGLSMAHDARDFSQNLATLKQLYADMTGTDIKKVSAFKVLFGKVPDAVAMARKNMIKLIGISEAADALGMAINIKGAMKNNWNMAQGFLAYQLPDWISGGARSMLGNTVLPAYDMLRTAYKSGVKITAEDYAVLLNSASKDLQERGENNPFTMAVAGQYAAERANPTDVMKEISDGKLMARLHKVMEANAAETAKAAHSVEAKAVSHVDKLTKGSQAQREVLGKHTGSIAREPIPGTGISPA